MKTPDPIGTSNIRPIKQVSFLVAMLAGLALTTGAKVVWNGFSDSEDDPSEVFSKSASEARRAGILISDLIAGSSPGTEQTQTLMVSEAWIEKCAVHRYSLVWFHRRVPTGGATVVIKLKEPADPRLSLWPPARTASFGRIGGAGGNYFVRYFETAPEFPMTLDGGKEGDLVPVLTLGKPDPSPQPPTGLAPGRG